MATFTGQDLIDIAQGRLGQAYQLGVSLAGMGILPCWFEYVSTLCGNVDVPYGIHTNIK